MYSSKVAHQIELPLFLKSMKCKLIIFFLAISNLIFAQINRKNNNTTLIFKVNVTSLIDVTSFPTVQFSVEQKLSRNFSLNSEVGYQLYTYRYTDTTFLSPEGFKVNFEGRYYLPNSFKDKIPKLEGIYVGLRPFYRQNQYNAYIPFQTKSDSTNWNEDDFGVKNKTYGLCFILGFQKSISHKLIFDFYSGLGVEKRIVENTDIQYNKDSGDILGGTDLMQFLWKFNLSESSGLWGNISFGFRIGYKF